MLVKVLRRIALVFLLAWLGAILNVVIFAAGALALAGADGEAWVERYLSIADGLLFLVVSIVLAVAAFPFARRLPFSRFSRGPFDPP
jgi:hypothetical protein